MLLGLKRSWRGAYIHMLLNESVLIAIVVDVADVLLVRHVSLVLVLKLQKAQTPAVGHFATLD